MRTLLRRLAVVLVASVCTVLTPTLLGAAAPPAPREAAAAPEASPGSTVTAPAMLAPATVPPPDAPEGWWSKVQEELAASEYEVTWQSGTVLADLPAAWQAPNRAQNFRTYFAGRGIRVVPRTEESPSWEWGLALSGYGRGGRVWQVAEPTVRPAGNRVEYARGRVEEWYENSPRGLKQGFTLAAPPEEPRGDDVGAVADTVPPGGPQGSPPDAGRKGQAVFVQLELSGTLDPVFATDGQAIDFRTGRGANVVHFAELRVTDARGRELPAWMEGFAAIGARAIRIAFDDTDAAYPVTIDPLGTTPPWTAESDQDIALFGARVATAGDVNGDGYSDVIVGAFRYDNGEADEGRAYVYLGSASGLAASPAWTAESGQASSYFGWSVATAGDVNGDGYSDVIVGARWYDNGESNEGRAYVYSGSASGLTPSPSWMAEGNQASAIFGYAVATAGDVNADGYSDVIVGAYGYTNGETAEGRAYVYLGSASGVSSSSSWTAESNQASAYFGASVGTAGDVNGDGYADVVVGSDSYDNGQADEGRAWLYLGSASGLAASPAWTAESDQAEAHFAISLATAGDVNGDGYSDVVVGAYRYDNGQADEGRAYVYLGTATGLAASSAWTAESDQASADFGFSVATAGDVNGDGYSDVIVGAPAWEDDLTDEGSAYVYLGSASGLAAAPVWTGESNQASASFGYSVGTAGDVNGDGYSDVVIGAPAWDRGQTDEGRAYVYTGSAAGPASSPGWTAESNQASAYFGYSVAGAGDVNGDGYSDVIVGATYYDNGQADEGRVYVYHGSASGLAGSSAWTAESNQASAHFGWSVATAGDVNGDGYADVIVGAHDYDNDQADEGRAYLYLGSSTGLAASPAWTGESDQGSVSFGHCVATAGDVNGDGYGDVIVGAPYYNSRLVGEGRVYVYAGSAAGLASSPAWTAEGGQFQAFFGRSVATAGDVNRDGYSDIIIGAEEYDNGQLGEGRAYVYLGSATGLAASPAWSAEGNQANANFGHSVASAGDVNGDGYSDVIVGAWLYDNDQSGEGRAYVYLGTAAGPAASAAWTAESHQTGSYFAGSVATAGDVNGDGYADVIVGASSYDNVEADEGRAYVYLGSASGLAASPAWTAESNQATANFGWSVASAGDVNGDGYSDIIVGAHDYDNGMGDEGRAGVFYGNEGRGVTLRPRQRRADNAAPIAHLGVSDSPGSFRLGFLGRTPFGRGKVKLAWEAKPLGSLFNGAGVQTGTAWSDTRTTGVSLNELVSGLAGGTPYHWRVRLRYQPATVPFQPQGRWMTVPWKGWQETMLRTAMPAAGRVPSGAPDEPLRVAKAAGSDITLTWGPSCLLTDIDYAIYEGAIGAWYSHVSLFCSTSGARTKTLAPLAGNKYYLVVPQNTGREGSYGTRSDGTERPQGVAACKPQLIGACP